MNEQKEYQPSEFFKYQHVERFGTDETEGIELGECYIFPKIDGTNASCWLNSKTGEICAGSRNRLLSVENDNAGFCKYVQENAHLESFFREFSDFRLYGEWLVPHSLKTYRESSWRQFYVFDVVLDDGSYMHYDQYSEILEEYGIQFIPPLRIINNPTYENLIKCTEANDYLIKDGEGKGEGIVIKNYSYRNKYGRQTWAKIVTSEFREKHVKEMGAPKVNGSSIIEQDIVESFCTDAFIEKTYEKVKLANDGFNSRNIAQLLGTIYHDFVVEETWHAVKKFRNPKINFKTLNTLLIRKTKEVLTNVF